MTNRTRAAAIAVLSTAAVLSVGVGNAAGGGSHLSPVKDRYEAGDVATLVGYTGGPALATDRSGPYRAFLWHPARGTRVEVGRLELTDTGRRGWDALRVAVTFTIPADSPPGEYHVTYCADPCTSPTLVGDVIGGFMFVGLDPLFRLSRVWPLDEPEIANLADEALLSGPGYQATAAEVRAGSIVPRLGPPSEMSPPPRPPATAPAVLATTPSIPTTPSITAAPAAAPPSSQPPWLLFITVATVAAGVATVAVRSRGARRLGPAPPSQPVRDDALVLTYERDEPARADVRG